MAEQVRPGATSCFYSIVSPATRAHVHAPPTFSPLPFILSSASLPLSSRTCGRNACETMLLTGIVCCRPRVTPVH